MPAAAAAAMATAGRQGRLAVCLWAGHRQVLSLPSTSRLLGMQPMQAAEVAVAVAAGCCWRVKARC